MKELFKSEFVSERLYAVFKKEFNDYDVVTVAPVAMWAASNTGGFEPLVYSSGTAICLSVTDRSIISDNGLLETLVYGWGLDDFLKSSERKTLKNKESWQCGITD